jgi:membrane protein
MDQQFRSAHGPDGARKVAMATHDVPPGPLPALPPRTPAASPGRLTARLDAYQRAHTWAAYPIAVVYKYFDDFGPYLAALLTYYAFVSLFPLFLLLSTILGYVLRGDPQLQHDILRSALGQFPVIGDQLHDPKRFGGGAAGLVIGFLGAVYGSLGVAQAVQYAMNTAWAVPRNDRPNPFTARGRSLLLVGTAGLALIGTTAMSAVGSSDVGGFGGLLRVVAVVASVLVNAAVFVLAFRLATTRELSVRDVAPGALTGAVAWQLLQLFGVPYVTHVIRHASATNGVFALVLGLLAFLYLTAVAAVLSVEINVVRVDRLYPRALLTPFTDNVKLTRSDRRAYRKQAQAQRAKGFEDIEVTFDQRDTGPED